MRGDAIVVVVQWRWCGESTTNKFLGDETMASTFSGDWRIDAHAINGQTGSHYDLAQYAGAKGFEVEADTDDNERSVIARPGSEDFGDRVIGEIVGDAEATITIYPE